MKPVRVALESLTQLAAIRTGLVYQVETKDVSIKASAYRDEFDNIWFRPLVCPTNATEDYRIHIGQIKTLFFLDYLKVRN